MTSQMNNINNPMNLGGLGNPPIGFFDHGLFPVGPPLGIPPPPQALGLGHNTNTGNNSTNNSNSNPNNNTNATNTTNTTPTANNTTSNNNNTNNNQNANNNLNSNNNINPINHSLASSLMLSSPIPMAGPMNSPFIHSPSVPFPLPPSGSAGGPIDSGFIHLQQDFLNLQAEYQKVMATQSSLVQLYIQREQKILMLEEQQRTMGQNNNNNNTANNNDGNQNNNTFVPTTPVVSLQPTNNQNSKDNAQNTTTTTNNSSNTPSTGAMASGNNNATNNNNNNNNNPPGQGLTAAKPFYPTNHSVQQLDELDRSIAGLKQQAQQHSHEFKMTRLNINDLRASLESLNTSVNTYSASIPSIDPIQTKIDQMSADYTALEKKNEQLKTDQTKMGNQIQSAQSLIQNLQQQYQTQNAIVTSHQTMIKSNSSYEAIIIQIQHQQDKIMEAQAKSKKDFAAFTTQSQEITKNFASFNAINEATSTQLAQVAKLVEDHTRQISNLQHENEHLKTKLASLEDLQIKSNSKHKSQHASTTERLDQLGQTAKRDRERHSLEAKTFTEFMNTASNESKVIERNFTQLNTSVSQITSVVSHDQSILIQFIKKDHLKNKIALKEQLSKMHPDELRRLFTSGEIVITQQQFRDYLDYMWFICEPDPQQPHGSNPNGPIASTHPNNASTTPSQPQTTNTNFTFGQNCKILSALHRSPKFKMTCLAPIYWRASLLSNLTPIEYYVFLYHIHHNVLYEDDPGGKLELLFSRVGLPYVIVHDDKQTISYFYLSYLHTNTKTAYTQHSLNDLIELILIQQPLHPLLQHFHSEHPPNIFNLTQLLEQSATYYEDELDMDEDYDDDDDDIDGLVEYKPDDDDNNNTTQIDQDSITTTDVESQPRPVSGSSNDNKDIKRDIQNGKDDDVLLDKKNDIKDEKEDAITIGDAVSTTKCPSPIPPSPIIEVIDDDDDDNEEKKDATTVKSDTTTSTTTTTTVTVTGKDDVYLIASTTPSTTNTTTVTTPPKKKQKRTKALAEIHAGLANIQKQVLVQANNVQQSQSYVFCSFFSHLIGVFRFITVLSRSYCTRQGLTSNFPAIMDTFITQMTRKKSLLDVTIFDIYYLTLFWAVLLYQDSFKQFSKQHPVCNSIYDCIDELDPNISDVFAFLNEPFYLLLTQSACDWDIYLKQYIDVLNGLTFHHEKMSQQKRGFLWSGMSKVNSSMQFAIPLQQRIGLPKAPLSSQQQQQNLLSAHYQHQQLLFQQQLQLQQLQQLQQAQNAAAGNGTTSSTTTATGTNKSTLTQKQQQNQKAGTAASTIAQKDGTIDQKANNANSLLQIQNLSPSAISQIQQFQQFQLAQEQKQGANGGGEGNVDGVDSTVVVDESKAGSSDGTVSKLLDDALSLGLMRQGIGDAVLDAVMNKKATGENLPHVLEQYLEALQDSSNDEKFKDDLSMFFALASLPELHTGESFTQEQILSLLQLANEGADFVNTDPDTLQLMQDEGIGAAALVVAAAKQIKNGSGDDNDDDTKPTPHITIETGTDSTDSTTDPLGTTDCEPNDVEGIEGNKENDDKMIGLRNLDPKTLAMMIAIQKQRGPNATPQTIQALISQAAATMNDPTKSGVTQQQFEQHLHALRSYTSSPPSSASPGSRPTSPSEGTDGIVGNTRPELHDIVSPSDFLSAMQLGKSFETLAKKFAQNDLVPRNYDRETLFAMSSIPNYFNQNGSGGGNSSSNNNNNGAAGSNGSGGDRPSVFPSKAESERHSQRYLLQRAQGTPTSGPTTTTTTNPTSSTSSQAAQLSLRSLPQHDLLALQQLLQYPTGQNSGSNTQDQTVLSNQGIPLHLYEGKYGQNGQAGMYNQYPGIAPDYHQLLTQQFSLPHHQQQQQQQQRPGAPNNASGSSQGGANGAQHAISLQQLMQHKEQLQQHIQQQLHMERDGEHGFNQAGSNPKGTLYQQQQQQSQQQPSQQSQQQRQQGQTTNTQQQQQIIPPGPVQVQPPQPKQQQQQSNKNNTKKKKGRR